MGAGAGAGAGEGVGVGVCVCLRVCVCVCVVVCAGACECSYTGSNTAYRIQSLCCSSSMLPNTLGVHRGVEFTGDVSADLTELARTPVAVICE